MKLKNLSLVALASLSLLSISTSYAGAYVDANLGYSGITSSTSIMQGGKTLFNHASNHFGWGANVGYLFLGSIGPEIGYTRYADLNYKDNKGASAKTSLESYHIAAKGVFNFGPVFFADAKLGYAYLQQGNFSISNVPVSRDAWNFFWAIGAGVNLGSHIYTQLQYQQVQGKHGLPNTYITTLGIGAKL